MPPEQATRLVYEVLRSSGCPLDHATRAIFEPHFGQDLSGKRGPHLAGGGIRPGEHSISEFRDNTPARTVLLVASVGWDNCRGNAVRFNKRNGNRIILAHHQARDGVSESACSISAHTLYARVLTKPGRHRFAAPVGSRSTTRPCSRSQRMVPYRWPLPRPLIIVSSCWPADPTCEPALQWLARPLQVLPS